MPVAISLRSRHLTGGLAVPRIHHGRVSFALHASRVKSPLGSWSDGMDRGRQSAAVGPSVVSKHGFRRDGLPASFDPKTGENIKWSVPLGTECYATPVVAAGKVLIGTNNNQPRDPRHRGDRGVLLCLNESDGSLCWQLVVPKLENDPFLDWPNAGMCSPATVEGDRIYMVTNRDEVVCLTLNGLRNGNHGPYRDEGRRMSPKNQPAMAPTDLDADILWLFDMRSGEECARTTRRTDRS